MPQWNHRGATNLRYPLIEKIDRPLSWRSVNLSCDKQTKSILRIWRLFRILQAVGVISSNYALNHNNLGNDVPQAFIPNHIRQRLIYGFVNLSRLKDVRIGDTDMLPCRPNITMSIWGEILKRQGFGGHMTFDGVQIPSFCCFYIRFEPFLIWRWQHG